MSYGQVQFAKGVLATPLATYPGVFSGLTLWNWMAKKLCLTSRVALASGYSVSKYKKIKTGRDCHEFYTLARDESSWFCLECVISLLTKMHFAFP